VFPAPWRDVLFVANPITRQVQAIKIDRDANGYQLQKLPDFMNSSDEWFRPIAIHFGPDGCLYVVDWYNKIISHNEVPRNHPDRDKTHGRVWRIRPENYIPGAIPNVAKASNSDLLKHLTSGNKWEWNAALHQIAQRPAPELAGRLATLAETGQANKAAGIEAGSLQIRALWALESLGKVEAPVLAKLLQHENPLVRREAVRVAGTRLKPDTAVALVAPLAEDPNHYVRSEVIRVAGGQDSPWKHHIISGAEKRPDRPLSGAAMELLVSMAKPALGDPSKPGPGYEREFERYLIRGALERHPKELAAFLDSSAGDKVPGDNRLFASLALPPAEAARRLGIAIEKAPRPVSDEELATMLQNPSSPEVRMAIDKMSLETPNAKALAKGAARLRTRLNAAEVEPLLRSSTKLLLASASEDDLNDALKLASGFKVRAVEPEVSGLLSKPNLKVETQVAALRALREFQSGPTEILFKLANDNAAPTSVRNEAVSTLAASHQADAAPKLFTLWPTLNEGQRKPLIDQLSGNKAGAETLLAALKTGTVIKDELPMAALEKMHTVLPSHPQMNELWQEMSARMKRVMRFGGDKADYVKTALDLSGPFTVETWLRLDPGIDNVDGILGSAKRAENSLDMNFYGSQFRVWVGNGQNDIVVAKRKAAPDAWTHYAVTRDAKGEFRIYINGELDATSKQRSTITYSDLDIARTLPQTKGTAGTMTEFRVWNVVRTPSEILASFDRSFAGEALPKGLRIYFPGNNGSTPKSETKLIDAKQMHGKARIEGTLEAPALLTAKEAHELDEKFGKFRTIAESTGDLASGKQLFTSTCLVCHQAGGQGAGFAPNLDGSALRTTEGLLRAILTPSAAMEAGYRKFRVETRDGEIYEGFLAQQDANGVVLRQPNVEPLKIASKDIKRAGFQNVSIMPEGLLEGLPPKQVSDLFTYLRSLK
jgi:putative heme-binding domain-containing protein